MRSPGASICLFALLLLAGTIQEALAEPIGYCRPRILEEGVGTRLCLDALGRRVLVPADPRRVVVHFVSFVAPWYLAGGKAVGIPELSDPVLVPEAARGLPSTGGASVPNIERILLLDPDLVILSASGEISRRSAGVLTDLGIPVLLLSYENYGDFSGLLDFFVGLNGARPEAEAARDGIRSRVEALTARTRALPDPTFLSLFSLPRGLKLESSLAHTAYMACLLGARNLADGMSLPPGSLRVDLSEERLALSDPDIILVTTMGDSPGLRDATLAAIADSKALSGLRAVREGRLYLLPSRYFLYKPNGDFPEAFLYLASRLYGQVSR